MRSFIIRCHLLTGLLALTGCGDEKGNMGTLYYSDIPDLSQAELAAGTGLDPETICGPVAVTNGLAWLAGRSEDRDYQQRLVQKLGSADYMNTAERSGTPANRLIRGIKQHLRDSGQAYSILEYRGRYRVASEYRGQEPLSVPWLVDSLDAGRAVWLVIGWYTSPAPGYYESNGSHWVTLAGHVGSRLIIHDPGRWQAPGEESQALQTSTFVPIKTAPQPFNPPGPMIRLHGAASPNGELAIIDGAVVLGF